MRVRFAVEGDRLTFAAPGMALPDERALGPGDVGKLRDWAATYRGLPHDPLDREPAKDLAGAGGQAALSAKLTDLGRDLFGWLDGDGGWLRRVLAQATGAVEIEFAAPLHPTLDERAFVEAPWELLAWPEGGSGSGFLAADAIRRFCPYRRLGAEAVWPAPSDHRLGIAFMAASPRGGVELDFEGEENAIIAATRRIGVDLEVEDSGNLGLLAERLAELDRMQIVHLSCHGTNRPEPRLQLEDEAGNEEPVAAADLAGALGIGLPEVLFLSACLTAAGAVGEADPLVTAMVRAGLPAVIGWDGSVRDGEATRFAAVFYGELQRKAPLAAAVATARRQLLVGDADHRPARDWHLARLWLGPAGGGPLVSGKNRKRRALAEEHGFKAFLDKRQSRSPVASREAFVGRRRELQRCLAVLRGQSKPGVLIHGMGRLGKSSLAARLASRMTAHETAVLYEGYHPHDLLAALRATSRETAALIDQRAAGLQPTAEGLELLLREILEGPASGNEAGKPVLLVIDDLEQILDDPLPGGLHRVKPEQQALMTALLRAFDPARTESRLVLTSRYRFTLPDRGADLAARLHDEQLGPMHEAGARKQALRRTGGVDLAAGNAELVNRAVGVARGHPGLQDLLLDLVADSPGTAATAVGEMEAYLAGKGLPSEVKIKAHLLDLTLNHLLGLLSTAERGLLRAATLFELPVPFSVLRLLESAVGGRFDRLLALGLVDRFEDVVRPEVPAGVVSALVAPLLGKLAAQEASAMAGLAVESLFIAWGEEERRGKPAAADLELTRLALLAGHARVAAVCGPWALRTLRKHFAYRQAAEWAKALMAVVEREPAPALVSVRLLLEAADAVETVGEPKPARVWLEQAVAIINKESRSVSIEETGMALLAKSQSLMTEARIDEALPMLHRAYTLLHEAGMDREAMIVLSEIARIRADRGDVEGALALHGERLAVYERLGDARERAVTLGDVAQLRAERGDIEGALALHEQRLSAYERLGETREWAATLGQMAQARATRGELDDAAQLCEEALQAFERLGDVREQAALRGELAQIRVDQGRYAEAMDLLKGVLQVFDQLGEVRERSATLFLIGKIYLSQREITKAFLTIDEAYTLVRQLGELSAVAIVGKIFGMVMLVMQKREQGLAILRESEAGFRRLGQPGDADEVAELIRRIEAEGRQAS